MIIIAHSFFTGKGVVDILLDDSIGKKKNLYEFHGGMLLTTIISGFGFLVLIGTLLHKADSSTVTMAFTIMSIGTIPYIIGEIVGRIRWLSNKKK